jgi:hypothetical protein
MWKWLYKVALNCQVVNTNPADLIGYANVGRSRCSVARMPAHIETAASVEKPICSLSAQRSMIRLDSVDTFA